VYLYDSMSSDGTYPTLRREFMNRISPLLASVMDFTEEKVGFPKQSDSNHCGAFVWAFAASVAAGIDPTEMDFRSDRMARFGSQ
jgi:hypothetical protein